MLIYKAINTAIKAHENQLRKLDNDIYVVHPLEVGVILAKHNMSDDVIIAGILHDTVEDTAMTLEEIENNFGPRVSLYVDFCSESNKCDPWKKRKLDYLSALDNAPIDVLYIVCADKLTNINSISRNLEKSNDTIWLKFNAGYDDQKWYYMSVLEKLSPISEHPLYKSLEHVVRRVFDL